REMTNDGNPPQPVRQKRQYTKRGTGSTAKKKRALVASGAPRVCRKEVPARVFGGRINLPADYPSVFAAANRSVAILREQQDVAALNTLLVLSAELELDLESTSLLDGLSRSLEWCLDCPRIEATESSKVLLNEQPWKDDATPRSAEEWRERAAKASTPIALAALGIARNVANVPSNRSAVAAHSDFLEKVVAFLDPPLLGSQAALLCLEIAASACRCVEIGGNYLDDPEEKAGFVPVSLRHRRTLAGWTTPKLVRKLRVAEALVRALRRCVAYSSSRSGYAFSLDGRRWLVYYEDDHADPEEHRRQVGARAFEALASLKNTEANFYLLATAPDDLVRRAVDRLAPDSCSSKSDSEIRLYALEFLSLLTDAAVKSFSSSSSDAHLPPLPMPPGDEAALAGVRVARDPLVLDLALATLVATHLKFNEHHHFVPTTTGTAAAGSLCIGAAHSTSQPPPPVDLSLAPLRSHRADTVRLLTNLLANMAALDSSAKARLHDARTLLHPAAAADEAVADLVFNKL
ncbi:hypothetical protein CTAYLR_002625, partial [Chrysophaeum taylorii]